MKLAAYHQNSKTLIYGWMWIISCMRCYFYYFILDFFLNI
jgi:hypothetical protein